LLMMVRFEEIKDTERHTHTQRKRQRENTNPSVVDAAKQAEMFADFPIIVKLHQKIVVSHMSLEAIAIGFFF
jgi:hypothetical protein